MQFLNMLIALKPHLFIDLEMYRIYLLIYIIV